MYNIGNNEEKAVTKKTDDGSIYSPYFNVKVSFERLSNLSIKSSSLVTAIAFMDFYRSEESRKFLETRFFEVLSLCETTDDFKKVTELLKNLADIGGYAVEFYSNANTKINQKGKEEAIQILEERNKPVTKKTDDGSIYSPYFNVKVSFERLSNLSIKSSSLVTAIAFMDLYRSEESRKFLETRFFEVLSLCETTDDFKKVTELLKNLADIGGYAVEFYSNANIKINQKGKEEAIQILEERNKSAKKKTTDDLNRKYLSELAIEWKEKYKISCLLFREMLENNNNIIRTTFEDIDELLIRFNVLKNDLVYLSSAFDQKYVEEKKGEIDDIISNLKKLQKLISSEEQIWGIHR